MTFKQLQDDTLDFCQELQSIPDFNLTKIKHHLNRGNKDFVRQTKCLQLDIDITTVADQVSYTSSDAANLAFVYHAYEVRYINDTEEGNKLKVRDRNTLPEVYQYGLPYQYWIDKNNSKGSFEIGTFPIITEGSKTLRVKAFIFPLTDMSSDSHEPSMKEAWQDALPEYAASRLFRIYSHKSDEFKKRSRDHFAMYQGYVDDFNSNSIKESDEFTVMQDEYGDY